VIFSTPLPFSLITHFKGFLSKVVDFLSVGKHPENKVVPKKGVCMAVKNKFTFEKRQKELAKKKKKEEKKQRRLEKKNLVEDDLSTDSDETE
jgi:hypothetical protein